MAKPRPRIKKRKSRRKLGARSYKNYTPEMLEIAVQAVKNKTISSRDAEKQFGIPRRTIINKLNNLHLKAVGAPTRLTIEEENKLINVIIASADFGYPLTKLDVRILVHNYLVKNGKTDLFNTKMPGDKWINNFLARHNEKLTFRSTQNIGTSRAQKGEEEMLNYFDNLRETLENVPPSNILNYDETNCNDDPGSSKAIFRRGVKYPERIINSTKGCVSIMFSGTADGQCLPPYVVYKSESMYTNWVENGPDDAIYNISRSGWFDSAIFEDYFRKVVLVWAKKLVGSKVVIGDNLSSHLNPDIIQLCEQYEIKFVFLPPNSTHITQPLDIAFYGPLKKEWRKILLKYKIDNPNQKTLNKKHFPKLLKALMEAIQLRKCGNIQSGFRAAGIYPLNPRQVLKRIPEFQFPDSTDYQIDEALLDYLKQSRAPNPMKVGRNKKIHIEPGKSVSVNDLGKKDLCQNKKSKNKNTNNKQNKHKTKKTKLMKTETDYTINKEHNIEDREINIVQDKKTKNSDTQKIDTLNRNKEKEIYYEDNSKENDFDYIAEYKEENHKTVKNKKNNIKTEKQEEKHTVVQSILNEKTGLMQKLIITSAIIETPKSQILTENIKSPRKAFNNDELDNIEVYDCEDTKENIENFVDKIRAEKKLNKKFKLCPGKKTKKIPNKRSKKLRTSSTTSEEIAMSIYSDSDIDLDQENNSIDMYSLHEIIDITVPSIDEREEEIFNEILRKHVESEKDTNNEDIRSHDREIKECDCLEMTEESRENVKTYEDTITKTTKNYDSEMKYYAHSAATQEIDDLAEYTSIQEVKEPRENNKNEKQSTTKNIDTPNYLRLDIEKRKFDIRSDVLVRYYMKKKWKYYIGTITEIDEQSENKYKISFYKTIVKNGDITFKKPKLPDVDVIPDDLIVKEVNMLQINDKNELILFDDEDSVYFD